MPSEQSVAHPPAAHLQPAELVLQRAALHLQRVAARLQQLQLLHLLGEDQHAVMQLCQSRAILVCLS